MGALTDYTLGFRQMELPATTITARRVYGGPKEIEAITTEKRAYVFLTKEAAEACVMAMTTEFTVSRRVYTFTPDNGDITYTNETLCVAKITASRRPDIDIYDVSVDVYDSVKTIT